jgi:acyl-coenzyme A thioesterase PaaI-like protein
MQRKMNITQLKDDLLFKFIGLWPPFLGAGIKLKSISRDYKMAEVEMNLTPLNRNYVGVHFGGSLYSMTDPWYMLMLIKNLGPEYLVWDKSANIRFKKPGKGKVKASFFISDNDLVEIKEQVARDGKTERDFLVKITDASHVTICEVEKKVWIAKKR